MQLLQQLDNVRVNDVVTYEYDDLLVYVSVAFFTAMTVIFLLIMSL